MEQTEYDGNEMDSKNSGKVYKVRNMKIDLVYLWVNGSDEKWLAKKNAALAKSGMPLSKSAASNNRWRDCDELKYSLRSVEKFAPWVNHIYIVTDEQVPEWLDLNNPKISIIDHKQIIPNEILPLFHSNAIEVFLWKIPNLSEYFLYSTDDMFFGKDVTPSFFFDENGNPIVILKERWRSFKNLEDYSQVNSRLFMINTARTIKFAYKKLNKKYHLAYKHSIEPIRKSYMEDNFKDLENDILKTTVTTFRDVNNLQRIILPIFDNAKRRNTIVLNWRTSDKRIVYNNEKDDAFRKIYHTLLWFFATITGFIKYDCYDKQWRILHFLKKYKPATFAINDFSPDKSIFELAADFFKEMFPNKSKFEI